MITLWRKRKVIKKLTHFTTVFSEPVLNAPIWQNNLIREGVPRDIFESQLETKTTLFLWKPKKHLSGFQILHRKNQIHDLVEDCLNNDVEQYIQRQYKGGADPKEYLFVTKEGRDLLEPFLLLGYWEALFSKYTKTVAFILGGGAVGLIWILQHIYHHIPGR